MIEEQSSRLQSIIEDILTLSRIEEEKRAISMEPSSLYQVLSSAIEVCQPRADEKNIDLHLAPRESSSKNQCPSVGTCHRKPR